MPEILNTLIKKNPWSILLIYTKFNFKWMLGLNIGEGNGTPLQYSCLENPMDGGAW